MTRNAAPTVTRKKLIEVALPLDAINKESAREKSIRHGHPSTLHLWWARRPLAACRAVLFASLVDDPDHDPMFAGSPERAGLKRTELFNLIEELVKWENSNNPDVLNRARAEIARCVASQKIDAGELEKDEELELPEPNPYAYRRPEDGEQRSEDSDQRSEDSDQRSDGTEDQSPVTNHQSPITPWDFMKRTATPRQVNAFLAAHAPPVLDPFCGGGSIPLEAQRLGLRAYGSDLNPVAVLITKALIEIPPKFDGRRPVNPESRKQQGFFEKEWHGAEGLAEDVRYYGNWMRDEAEKRIGHLYPKVKVTAEMAKDRPDLEPYVGQKLTVIAWLWARTVPSPNPAASNAPVPLVRSFWLSKKKGKEAWILPVVDPDRSSFRFEVQLGPPSADFKETVEGTVGRRGGRCVLTDAVMPLSYIRTQGRDGHLGRRLMAVVVQGKRGRIYVSPSRSQESISETAEPVWKPEAALPNNPRDFKTPNYGLTSFSDLFTNRQLTALSTFGELIEDVRAAIETDAAIQKPGDEGEQEDRSTVTSDYADAVTTYLAFAVSRGADAWSSLTSWRSGVEATRGTFARQALPMVWDFAEANPFSDAWGNWCDACIGWIVKAIEGAPSNSPAFAKQQDATTAVNGMEQPLVSTDPPYYDNIGYADLSDFFYIWLRYALRGTYPQLFSTLLTPKDSELVATPYRHDGNREKAKEFFEDGLQKTFREMNTAHNVGYPLTIFYAFKQAESSAADDSDGLVAALASTGWETMLEGLISTGFGVTGTWPMRTERTGRTMSVGMNALASSIVLVCRPRPEDASMISRREFLTELKRELPEALRMLQQGNIAPVDLAQAAIGPGMAVFSRYAKVLESDGSPMRVRTALGLINQTLDEVLAEQEGEFDADTRWAIAWFDQHAHEEGPYGEAETLSTAKNVSVRGLEEAGILKAKSGKVRLLKRDEYADGWTPSADGRAPIWEQTQYLIRALEEDGESGAGGLLSQLGADAEVIRDLAYRLYTTCERKKWAQEALAYNSLVVAWPEISKLAREEQAERKQQTEMF